MASKYLNEISFIFGCIKTIILIMLESKPNIESIGNAMNGSKSSESFFNIIGVELRLRLTVIKSNIFQLNTL